MRGNHVLRRHRDRLGYRRADNCWSAGTRCWQAGSRPGAAHGTGRTHPHLPARRGLLGRGGALHRTGRPRKPGSRLLRLPLRRRAGVEPHARRLRSVRLPRPRPERQQRSGSLRARAGRRLPSGGQGHPPLLQGHPTHDLVDHDGIHRGHGPPADGITAQTRPASGRTNSHRYDEGVP